MTARTTWPSAAEMQRAADTLRTAGPQIPHPLGSLADPVADWLDATANALAWLAPFRPHEPGYRMWETATVVAQAINGTPPADSYQATRGEPGPDAQVTAGAPASRPPLTGLVRQIRATANADLPLPTSYGARAVRDFARDLEKWIPEDFEPEAFDRTDWVHCTHHTCRNGEYRAKATERGWHQGPMDAWLCTTHAPGGGQ